MSLTKVSQNAIQFVPVLALYQIEEAPNFCHTVVQFRILHIVNRSFQPSNIKETNSRELPRPWDTAAAAALLTDTTRA